MKEKVVCLVNEDTRSHLCVSIEGINKQGASTVRKPWRYLVHVWGEGSGATFANKKDALDRFYKKIGYLVAHGYVVEKV